MDLVISVGCSRTEAPAVKPLEAFFGNVAFGNCGESLAVRDESISAIRQRDVVCHVTDERADSQFKRDILRALRREAFVPKRMRVRPTVDLFGPRVGSKFIPRQPVSIEGKRMLIKGPMSSVMHEQFWILLARCISAVTSKPTFIEPYHN